MSFPSAPVMRVLGKRTVVPSSNVRFDVKMIHPAVGSPTTCPSFIVRYPSVKSSASLSECWLVTSTVGRSSDRWPSDVRAPMMGSLRDCMLRYDFRVKTSRAYAFTNPPLLLRMSMTTPSRS